MSLVRLLGFQEPDMRMRHRPVSRPGQRRELTYVEEKGPTCETHAHRRNHTVANLSARPQRPSLIRSPGVVVRSRPERAPRARYNRDGVPPAPSPTTILRRGRPASLFPRRLHRLLALAARAAWTSSSPRRPITWASATARYDDTMPRPEYLEWTSAGAAAAARRCAPTVRCSSTSAPSPPTRGRRWTWRRPPGSTSSCRTPSTGSSRSPSKKRWPARGALDEDLAVGHYKPINSQRFLHDCHEFVFHFTPGGRTPLDRQAVGVRYQDQSNVATVADGGGRGSDAGGTPGSFPTTPSRTATRIGRTRPPFPPKLPEMCVRLHGLERVAPSPIRFWAWARRRVACVELGVDFVGFEWTRPISRKPSPAPPPPSPAQS